jgi:hypothetical protein
MLENAWIFTFITPYVLIASCHNSSQATFLANLLSIDGDSVHNVPVCTVANFIVYIVDAGRPRRRWNSEKPEQASGLLLELKKKKKKISQI